jgi:hypothetical protein
MKDGAGVMSQGSTVSGWHPWPLTPQPRSSEASVSEQDSLCAGEGFVARHGHGCGHVCLALSTPYSQRLWAENEPGTTESRGRNLHVGEGTAWFFGVER